MRRCLCLVILVLGSSRVGKRLFSGTNSFFSRKVENLGFLRGTRVFLSSLVGVGSSVFSPAAGAGYVRREEKIKKQALRTKNENPQKTQFRSKFDTIIKRFGQGSLFSELCPKKLKMKNAFSLK